MEGKSVVIITTYCPSMNIIYNALKGHLPVKKVIAEDPESRTRVFFRRIRRLGIITVIGQSLFKLCIIPYLKLSSRKRLLRIAGEYSLDESPVDPGNIIRVRSINSEEAKIALKSLEPDVVAVYGIRVISKNVLQSVSAKFVNLHMGIAPAFRGLASIYWALVRDGDDACGVTVHLVDKGIDTGAIIRQKTFRVSKEDSFVTYNLIALAEGLPVFKTALREILEGRAEIRRQSKDNSRLYSDPTLGQYLSNVIRKGIR